MPADLQPIWRPISDLPLIAWAIRNTLECAKEQYDTLVPCRPTPHVLDGHLIGRVSKLHREQKEDLRFYQEQLARWKKQKLTAGQRKEIEALAGELANAAAMIDSVIALAEELSDGTIDKVMAKTDIGQGDLAGLRRNFPRIERSGTTDAQYRKAVASFERNPDPPGMLLNWVCRDSVEALDLTRDRFELAPARD